MLMQTPIETPMLAETHTPVLMGTPMLMSGMSRSGTPARPVLTKTSSRNCLKTPSSKNSKSGAGSNNVNIRDDTENLDNTKRNINMENNDDMKSVNNPNNISNVSDINNLNDLDTLNNQSNNCVIRSFNEELDRNSVHEVAITSSLSSLSSLRTAASVNKSINRSILRKSEDKLPPRYYIFCFSIYKFI